MKIALYIKHPWAPNQVGLGSVLTTFHCLPPLKPSWL